MVTADLGDVVCVGYCHGVAPLATNDTIRFGMWMRGKGFLLLDRLEKHEGFIGSTRASSMGNKKPLLFGKFDAP